MKLILTSLFIIPLLSFRGHSTNDDIVGLEIKGDFNADKHIEQATAGPIRQFYPDQHMDGVGWMIKFDDKSIPDLTLGCCLSYMVNEGDLNGDGSDDLSVYSPSVNTGDCDYYMSTYTLSKTGWEKIIQPFAIAKGCEGLQSDSVIERVNVDEKGDIYYRADINGKRVVKKVAVKTGK